MQPQTVKGAAQTTSQPVLSEGNLGNENQSSNTWASSGEDPDVPSEEEDTGD